jgi:hypothetical protein
LQKPGESRAFHRVEAAQAGAEADFLAFLAGEEAAEAAMGLAAGAAMGLAAGAEAAGLAIAPFSAWLAANAPRQRAEAATAMMRVFMRGFP